MSEKTNVEEEIRMIYRLYFNDVYRFIASFTNNRNDIEDLTQEVFIRLFKSLPSFKGRSDLKTWLFSIARNVTVDHSRKMKRQKILQDYLLKWIPSKEKSIEEIVADKDDVTTLYLSLRQLKDDYRMVVLLRGIHELSIAETAKVMGWKESKVKVSYHRALKILKKDMGEDDEGVKERWM